jgi:hypothetical protein
MKNEHIPDIYCNECGTLLAIIKTGEDNKSKRTFYKVELCQTCEDNLFWDRMNND